MRNVIEQLRQRDHRVDLVAHDVPAPDTDANGDDAAVSLWEHAKAAIEAPLPDVAARALHGWYHRRQNGRLVRRNAARLAEADVIYERDTYQSFGAQRAAEKLDRPWIVECNGLFWGPESVFRAPWSTERYRARHVNKWRSATHIIAVSEQLKHRIVQEGIDPQSVSVIHNGVDVDPYRRVRETEVSALRHALDLAEDTLVVGFLGHVLPKHRIDLLLDALARLDRTDLHALLVGGGQVQDALAYAERIGVADRVTCTGPVPPRDVPKYVSAMDVGTVPGTSALDSPVKIFDYGAAGRPVVAADFAGVTEILTDETDGLLFERGSAAAFADVLQRLLSDPDRRRSLGRALRQTVESRHTWKQVGARTEAVLQRCVSPDTV